VLPLTAAGSGRSQTPDILNRSTHAQQQHDTSNWRQSFVVTEFMSAGINNNCLDCRRRNQLPCLKSLTKCHKHYARAHALWCAVKRDSLIRYDITYLTCGGSRFHVMTFNVCSASAVTWPNRVPNFRKPKNPRRNSQEAFFMRFLAQTHLGELIAFSQTRWPNVNFSRLRRSLLAALTRVVFSALVASTNCHPKI